MKKATRSLLLAVVASAMIFPVLASHSPIGQRRGIQIRAGSSVASTADSSAAPTSTHADSSSSAAATTTEAATSAAQTSAANSESTSSAGAASAAHSSSAQSSASQATAAASTVVATSTDSQGQLFTTVVAATPSASGSSPSPSSTPNNSSSGLSTGSIVGLSVAGGIAVLGVILFFVWKFTRKRFSDFDDNEAIKWPELNAHNTDVHALPTNNTGRAGFGPENDSDFNLARAPSPGGTYANSIGAASVPDVYGTGDPYAVPPLPHLNPNQPYRDEPGAYGRPASFYDPYRGPVPNTFTDNVSDGHGTEAYPMTQIARGRSPAPQLAYDMQGRSSPAPQAAMGYAGMDERSGTPTPAALGRATPSPHPASFGHPQ